MSCLTYFASDYPLTEVINPHYKTLSVNEALAIGMEVPEYFLKPEFDQDKPDVLLWSDLEININVDNNTFEDGNFDDDFSILLTDKAWDDMYTEKDYVACFDCRYTLGRAKRVLEYIRCQLQNMDELEFWNIWMGCDYRPKIIKRRCSIDDLTVEDIKNLAESNVSKEPFTQFCLVIFNEKNEKRK